MKRSFKRLWRASPLNRGNSRTRGYNVPPRRERRRTAKALWRVIK